MDCVIVSFVFCMFLTGCLVTYCVVIEKLIDG
jgi:hypothetical protein